MSNSNEIKDEELKEISGGFNYNPKDIYFGYDPSCFNYLQIGDRVKGHNLLGSGGDFYGTVVGFNVVGLMGRMGNPGCCRVQVAWDKIGSPTGYKEVLPSTVTKVS